VDDSLELDIAILNADPKPTGADASGKTEAEKRPAVVYARCASDVAISSLPHGAELDELLAFRDRINEVLLKSLQRPSKAELRKFGDQLFNYVIRDDVKELYTKLPRETLARIHILTDREDLKSLPWEFLQYPKIPSGPWRMRSVVRVIPTIGAPKPEPIEVGAGRKLKVLFVYARPEDQTFVSWPNVRESLQRTFATRLVSPDLYDLKVVRGTVREFLGAFENNDEYDVFQFSGHGDVSDGEGRILLLNESDKKSSPFTASQLAGLLAGRGIKLAVLSACQTSAGNAVDPFNVVAEALIYGGIPAVIANQFSVPDQSVADFVGPVYDQLLVSGDIDAAVNSGRLSISSLIGPQQPGATLEWGIPTLYRHVAGSKIFKPVGAPPAGQPAPPPAPQPSASQ
jgi:hypothetical protein